MYGEIDFWVIIKHFGTDVGKETHGVAKNGECCERLETTIELFGT